MYLITSTSYSTGITTNSPRVADTPPGTVSLCPKRNTAQGHDRVAADETNGMADH